MDERRTLLFQAEGAEFRPSGMGLPLAKVFNPGEVKTFGGRAGHVVGHGGATFRVPDGLACGADESQYEAAINHLPELLPAIRTAGATDFILHMRRTCPSLCNWEFTPAELHLLASLGCHYFHAARDDWSDYA